MSDNPKISFDLKEYSHGMEARILEDSKQRRENREKVTNTNFKSLEAVSDAREKAARDHNNSTRWLLITLVAIVGLVIAYVEFKNYSSRSPVASEIGIAQKD